MNANIHSHSLAKGLSLTQPYAQRQTGKDARCYNGHVWKNIQRLTLNLNNARASEEVSK